VRPTADVGLPLGVFLAAPVTRGLSSLGVRFDLPPRTARPLRWVAVAVAIAAGLLRRAPRLNVLEALQYE
jgi:hypothetical protein